MYGHTLQEYAIGLYVGWLIGGIIWGIIWGCATNAIIHNKGYDENWFWWGFFFSIIAVIVAATKPENRSRYQYDDSSNSSGSYIGYNYNYSSSQSTGPDTWRCSCGKINYNYVGTCSCGKSKYDVEAEGTVARAALEKAKKEAAEVKERAEKEAEEKVAEEKTAREPQVKDTEEVTDTVTEKNTEEAFKKTAEKQPKEVYAVNELTNAGAIREYKKLLDEGIITQEEFNAKKRQLLGFYNFGDLVENSETQSLQEINEQLSRLRMIEEELQGIERELQKTVSARMPRPVNPSAPISISQSNPYGSEEEASLRPKSVPEQAVVAESESVSEQAYAPNKESKSEQNDNPVTFIEHLEYANRFQTDDGMVNYLRRLPGRFSQEEEAALQNFLKHNPPVVRQLIGAYIQSHS